MYNVKELSKLRCDSDRHENQRLLSIGLKYVPSCCQGKEDNAKSHLYIGPEQQAVIGSNQRDRQKKTKQTSSPMNCNCVHCHGNVKGKKRGRYQGTQGLFSASTLSQWHKGHLLSAYWVRAVSWELKALVLNPVFAAYQLWDIGA